MGSDSSTVPHTILDHAAVQANVLDYVIVQFRKQPHVAADAQLPAIAVTSDRKPRAAAARQASKIVAWRPRGMGERTVEASYMSASIELASESRFQIRRDTIGPIRRTNADPPVRQHVGAFPHQTTRFPGEGHRSLVGLRTETSSGAHARLFVGADAVVAPRSAAPGAVHPRPCGVRSADHLMV